MDDASDTLEPPADSDTEDQDTDNGTDATPDGTANCGTCSGGKVCVDGECRCPITQEDCAGTCRFLGTDSDCSACGDACVGVKKCVEGHCIAQADPECLPDIPCVTNDDCPNGHRCNDALEPPSCHKLYCGGFDSACASEVFCLSRLCKDGKCALDCSERQCGPDAVYGESCGTCSAGWSCESGECICDSEDCFGVMVAVPGQSFWQGCNESIDSSCADNEKPYHEVHVPAFEIDKFEVTVDQYRACISAKVCSERIIPDQQVEGACNSDVPGRAEHPMNCVSWIQADRYCSWAGKRLCSESEWEMAARGIDGRTYSWGNETPSCDLAVMFENGHTGCGTDSTWPVGSKPAGASPYGALDMSGNIAEWVADTEHSDYTGAPTDGSAWGGGSNTNYRMYRGGMSPVDLRCASRESAEYNGGGPFYYWYGETLGIRCCR